MPSPSLPQEILDHIIDTLQDDPKTLQDCCLVAKSWIPRSRKHLFFDIHFYSSKRLESWKKTFPDPSNSPACYVRSLLVACLEVIRAEDAAERGWITSFSGVVRLELEACEETLEDPETSLVPFHKFSLALKSLNVDLMTLPCSQFFKLVYSFPLLEDLFVICQFLDDDDDPRAVLPSSSPPFTGSLKLTLPSGSESMARQLLDLSGGLRFRTLDLLWNTEEDTQWVRGLVSACSNTVESLILTRLLYDSFDPTSSTIDLSIAPKLQEVTFRSGSLSVEWITVALRTVRKIQGLQRITFYLYDWETAPSGSGDWKTLGEQIHRQWRNLDCLLIQLWESRSIRPRMVGMLMRDEQGVRDLFGGLLPEITKRGIIDI